MLVNFVYNYPIFIAHVIQVMITIDLLQLITSKIEKKVYTVAPCSSNHGHISSKWYVLMFWQWFSLFSSISCL